jgi:outer membrane lipoprotein-sorting protein
MSRFLQFPQPRGVPAIRRWAFHEFSPMLLRVLSLVVLLALAPFAGPVRAEDDTAISPVDVKARKIVEDADRIRFPGEGFQVDVSIVTTGKDREPDEHKYRVLSKGNENTVVMITEPAAERGQIMLMKGHDLWVFLPNVSQPVRLSLSQRLTGQVANGDLARANFAGDYNPKVLRTDTLEGEQYDVLELTAVDRSVTYPRVVYWVNAKTSAPYKAEFYSASNRLLKTCRYDKYEKVLGKLRPTRLLMQDALHAGEISTLDYSAMKLRDLPDKVFTKDYLKKLE